jgi:hypothetical protein
MKKQSVIIGIVALLVCVGLSGCFGPQQGVEALKLSGGHGNSVNITEQQMNNFPHLKEAILTNKTVYVESPSQEMDKLRGIFEYFDPDDIFSDIIFYQNEYYEIRIKYAD